MNRLISGAVLCATLIVSQPVWAHTDESLDAMPSPHGGQVRAAGPYHMELIAKDGELVLHVTDHANNEVNTTGGEGKANIQQGKAGGKISVKLDPSQKNTMAGSGEFQIDPETVIVVFVKLPEQDAYAARFTPLKPKSVGKAQKASGDHGHDSGHHDQHKQH